MGHNRVIIHYPVMRTLVEIVQRFRTIPYCYSTKVLKRASISQYYTTHQVARQHYSFIGVRFLLAFISVNSSRACIMCVSREDQNREINETVRHEVKFLCIFEALPGRELAFGRYS